MKKITASLILIAAVAVCYAPAARDGFVWDDTALILRDPLIRSWRLIAEGFNHFLFLDATASDFYRPLQRLTYTLDYAAFAFRPAGYHIVSIFWQIVAAVAFFLFANELLRAFAVEPRKRNIIAFGAALVWAIHPVQSPAVIYISGRADPLAAAFGFAGCYFLLRQARATGLGKWFCLLGGGFALLFSVFSKEIGFVFPMIIILFFALRKNWTEVGKIVAVSAFVCAIYFSLRGGAEHIPPPQLSPPAPALVRPITVSRAVAEYAGLLLLPSHLHMDREVETNPTGLNPTSITQASRRELQTLLGVVLIAAFFYWMWRARYRSPVVFTSLLFALVCYLPISGIIALNANVAEHWIYFPSAFLFLAVAIEISSEFEKFEPRSNWKLSAFGLIAIWFLFLGVRTFVRCFDWKDERTFVQSTINSGGDSARMLINLGLLELNDGRFDDAAVHLHAALQKRPDQPMAILNLGILALKQNDLPLARQLLTRASKMPVVDARAYELLAMLDAQENKRIDLLRLRLASRTGASDWSIEKHYIQALDQSGARSAAINELLHCLQTEWYRADSWKLLSQLEVEAGHPDQAANALAQARAYDVHLE